MLKGSWHGADRSAHLRKGSRWERESPNGVVQHASYNADLLGRSVSETLRLVQAVQTGER